MSWRKIILFVALMLAPAALRGQAPPDFRWVNLAQSSSEQDVVVQALKGKEYTSVVKIGVRGDFALAFARFREKDSTCDDCDAWILYNVSLREKKATLLLYAYKLKVAGWYAFSKAGSDLSVFFFDCWECEPSSMFDAIHFDSKTGWRPLWGSEQPGAAGLGYKTTAVGDPYTDDVDISQVFAVLISTGESAVAGTWFHSVDGNTRKTEDDVTRCTLDVAEIDKCVSLTGREAVAFEQRLCVASDAPANLRVGQSSPACVRLLAKDTEPSKPQ